MSGGAEGFVFLYAASLRPPRTASRALRRRYAIGYADLGAIRSGLRAGSYEDDASGKWARGGRVKVRSTSSVLDWPCN
jgi:hypothetical protein